MKLTKREYQALSRCVTLAEQWRGNYDPADHPVFNELIKTARQSLKKVKPEYMKRKQPLCL